jgi:hypothetical protein
MYLPLQKIYTFLTQHAIGTQKCALIEPLDGAFSLFRGAERYDLYGTVDAVYSFYTLGELQARTNRQSRLRWAEKILACQDDIGWFSRRNLRGHSKEHATAYAIGALCLLSLEPGEDYVSHVRPLRALLPILTDRSIFSDWIEKLDFRFSPYTLIQKKLGWHYIWRGAHVGGGIPAAIGMTQHLFDVWWPGRIDTQRWLRDYLDWLDAHVNPRTGFWQRAFWNLVYHRPTLIDLGGAVHFLWIYEAVGRGFPYPEANVKSTLALQRAHGLYKSHPFCIDLDGNFSLIRAYLQLSSIRQAVYRASVRQAVERNFEAILHAFTEESLAEMYRDSHGLPGALAALVECSMLPGFKYANLVEHWAHPLKFTWWL